MSFENENILNQFVTWEQSMQYKVDEKSGRTIYRCHNDFGALDGREIKNMVPKIVDFGLATRLDDPSAQPGRVVEQLGIYPIQPDYYRAPEVILGCGWDFKADIWNFGVLVRPFDLLSLEVDAQYMGLSMVMVVGLRVMLIAPACLAVEYHWEQGLVPAGTRHTRSMQCKVPPGGDDCPTWPSPEGIAREIKGHVEAQLAPACHERVQQTLQ
jgi:serine/threonine protein kinase